VQQLRTDVESERRGCQKHPVQVLEYGGQQQPGAARTSAAAIAPVGNKEAAE
jgi:hypothetical protein